MNPQPTCEVIAISPQIEPPQIEVSQNGRTPLTNFFPLSHDLFSNPKIRALSGDGFRVFLWLNSRAWQFPSSRGQIQASVGRLGRETGVSESNVSRILAILRDQKLIRLLRSDFKYGNIWEVQNLAKAKAKEVSAVPQDEGAAPPKKESTHLKTSEESPHFEGEVISEIVKEKKDSLSQSADAKTFENYLSALKPKKKRESESASLRLLLADYSSQEVELALSHLLEAGLPGSGQHCHSPMRYLAQAMAQVLSEAQAKANKSRLSAIRRQVEQDAEETRIAQDQREVECEDIKKTAFLKAFPTQSAQEAWIKKFADEHPVLRGCENALRSLAITAWHSENDFKTKGTM